MEDDKEEKPARFRIPPDKGYAWVVLIVSFLANILVIGFMISPGIFIIEWYTTYDRSKALTSWALGFMLLAQSAAGLLTGYMIERLGCCRTIMVGCAFIFVAYIISSFAPKLELLFLSMSMLGFGCGLSFSPPVVIIYDYFDKYKSLASGISMIGHSVGVFIFVAVIRYSIDFYGWRGAMLILAGTSLHLCPLALFLVPNLVHSNSSTTKTKSSDIYKEVLKDCRFLLFMLTFCLVSLEMDICYQISASRASTKGLSKIQSSMMLTCLGLGSAFGRLLLSFILNTKCLSPALLYVIIITIMAITMVLSCFAATLFVTLSIASIVLGICIGSCWTVVPALLVDLFGKQKLASSFGIMICTAGLFSFCTLPIAGLLYDATSDFNTSFYFGSALGGLAIIVSLLLVFYCPKYTEEHYVKKDETAETTI